MKINQYGFVLRLRNRVGVGIKSQDVFISSTEGLINFNVKNCLGSSLYHNDELVFAIDNKIIELRTLPSYLVVLSLGKIYCLEDYLTATLKDVFDRFGNEG